MEKRKYSNSQLRWLAESLTTQQMAYLMENDVPNQGMSQSEKDKEEQLNLANQNAGISQTPSNPGMKSTTQGSMKPTAVAAQGQDNTQQNGQNKQSSQNPQQTQDNAKNDKAQISTVCKAIKTGKLNKIEPEQLGAFVKNAGITTRNLAKAIKYAIEFMSSQMKNPKSIDMNVLRNTVAGINSCLAIMVKERNAVAESVMVSARNRGVESSVVSGCIRNNDGMGLMRCGYALTVMNESNKQLLPINNQIKEFYTITAEIKNLCMLAEKYEVDIRRFRSMQELAKKRDSEINESVSALKYAVTFFNKNK